MFLISLFIEAIVDVEKVVGKCQVVYKSGLARNVQKAAIKQPDTFYYTEVWTTLMYIYDNN